MARVSDALIAFWDGNSRGTAHMINFAKRRALDISVVNYLQNYPRSQKMPPSGYITPSENKHETEKLHIINRHRT
jgi:hypothetical protein